MDEGGQMILLSALLACLCLMGVVACVSAMDYTAYGEEPVLSTDYASNVVRAQESALQRAAHYHSSSGWDSRAKAVSEFKSAANISADSMAIVLLKHGMSYGFFYNESLASEYAALHGQTEGMGGVIVEKKGKLAMLKGCACDLVIGDGSRSYRVSKVVLFD